jgi:hypothetical protein
VLRHDFLLSWVSFSVSVSFPARSMSSAPASIDVP